MKIVVVDDKWDSEIKPGLELKSRLWNGFASFSGVSQFLLQDVLKEVERVSPSILLLDIHHGDAVTSGEEPAGIRLFNELGTSSGWEALKGKVQIVFFSSASLAKWHALVGRAKRVDVSGFVDKDELLEIGPKALEILRQAADLAAMYKESPVLADPAFRSLSDLVFSPNSKVMHDIWKQIVLAGRHHEPVFISGETGAGKELVAKAVFKVCQKINEGRTPGSCDFLPLNIAALPAEGNLQYIELFGAEAESFTGVTKPRKGLFELAGEAGASKDCNSPPPGGTIFLDEIGDAAPIVQVALLRVLQERTITPLGGFNSSKANKKISFRLISASHSLLKNVKNKLFREDLYYRLNGIHIHMPPLRERKDDIGVLVAIFIDNLNKEYGKKGYAENDKGEDKSYMGFDWEPKIIDDIEKLVEKLAHYYWPGNVRELEMSIRASYVSTIGNTFQLSDEVERRITEQEPTPRANVEQILESLRQNPLPLCVVAKKFTPPVAVQVYQALSIDGRSLDSDMAKQYFGQAPATLRRWVARALKLENASKEQEEHDV